MLVQDRERVRYNDDFDRYAYDTRNDRFARYDYDSRYEEARMRTSDYDRDSLMSSLERPASRSRLERSDADRYGFYRSNIEVAENNYDRLWDSRRAAESAARSSAPKSRKKKAMLVAYLALAFVAVIAVTLSVVGLGDKSEVKSAELVQEPISASAEEVVEQEEAAPVFIPLVETQLNTTASTEKYVVLKNGEKISVEVPKRTVETKEEEKGFDKFCSWLNGVFGG